MSVKRLSSASIPNVGLIPFSGTWRISFATHILSPTLYAEVHVLPEATLNTESPAWAIDRLSILALKIWHMKEQTERKDADAEHIAKCKAKLDVLLEQQVDLSKAIDQLLDDIKVGRKYMKVYRQMKMYNDPSTNPIFYKKS